MVRIVVACHQRILDGGWRHAGGIGQPQCGDAGAGLHQQQVGMPVVAAFKFDDLVPPGVGTCQPAARSSSLPYRN